MIDDPQTEEEYREWCVYHNAWVCTWFDAREAVDEFTLGIALHVVWGWRRLVEAVRSITGANE